MGRQAVMMAKYSAFGRSEEHTSELQALTNFLCRLLPEKKKTQKCFEAWGCIEMPIFDSGKVVTTVMEQASITGMGKRDVALHGGVAVVLRRGLRLLIR